MVARVFKDVADGFFHIAAVWLVVSRHGSGGGTALFAFCELIPAVVFGAISGPFLERHLKVWWSGGYLVRAASILTLVLFSLTGQLVLVAVYIVTAVQSCLNSTDEPIVVAVIPRLDDRHLQSAYAQVQSVDNVVTIAGLAGAGFIVATVSPAFTLELSAAMFLVAAALASWISTGISTSHEGRIVVSRSVRGTIRSYVSDIFKGFRIVNEVPRIRVIAIGSSIINLGLAPFIALLPIFVRYQLHGSAMQLSILEGATALGSLAMGILLSRAQFDQMRLFLFGSLASGVAMSLFGIQRNTWLAGVLLMILGVAQIAINVPEVNVVQTKLPEIQHAQVFAALSSQSLALLPVGLAVSGVFATKTNTGYEITFGGGLIMALALWLGVRRISFRSSGTLRDSEDDYSG
ncbi:MFS transporter [Sulfobacillus thermosulfidooxidans]|nr:MFS transporter [Sulfobacillus thermosulfidooxidans]